MFELQQQTRFGYIARRTAKQYPRLLASSIHNVVRASIRPSVTRCELLERLLVTCLKAFHERKYSRMSTIN